MIRLIEIKALENGAHRNQTINCQSIKVPEGWAVIPNDMVLENFPFGEVTAKKINGVKTVTSWAPGTIPEPEPEPLEEVVTE